MTSPVQIDITRADLRTLATLIGDGDYAEAASGLAAIFAEADDIEAQTLGSWLEVLANQLNDDDGLSE